MSEHYFSGTPQGPERRRTITADLWGERVELTTANGVFSGDRLDLGTSVLLREAPLPQGSPRLLDLGCGYGPIACVLATVAPGSTVYAVDVNARARELTAENAVALGIADRVRVAAPDDVPQDVLFAQVWSNPPIRVGKEELHAMLDRWLPRLAPDGLGWLVVARHLGGDSLQAWLVERGWRVDRYASQKGYRVLRVTRKID